MAETNVPEMFACNVFNKKVMRELLPKDTLLKASRMPLPFRRGGEERHSRREATQYGTRPHMRS